MAEEEKDCPACAESVKAAANICKHCGFAFNAQFAASTPPAKKEKSSGCGIVAVVLGLLFLFIITISSGGSVSSDRYARMTPEQKAAEEYRQKTGLYPDQQAEIIRHCNQVPRPWDC